MRAARGPDRPVRAASPAPAGAGPSTIAVAESFLEDPGKRKRLLRFCLWHLGRGATAEDAEDALSDFVKDCLPKVCAHYKADKGSFEAYLNTSLRNFCWKRGKELRRKRRVEIAVEQMSPADGVPADFDDPSPGCSPAEMLEQQEERSAVRNAVAMLSAEDEAVILLRYKDELSHAEIGERLNISEGAARTRLHRAQERVRQYLAVRHGGQGHDRTQ